MQQHYASWLESAVFVSSRTADFCSCHGRPDNPAQSMVCKRSCGSLREAVQLKLLTVTEKSGRVIAVDVSENAWGTNDVAM